MLALTNFDDIINNDNINEATQLLFDRINNGFKLCCPIRTKTLSPKNTIKPWISGEICANIKKRQNYYSLVPPKNFLILELTRETGKPFYVKKVFKKLNSQCISV